MPRRLTRSNLLSTSTSLRSFSIIPPSCAGCTRSQTQTTGAPPVLCFFNRPLMKSLGSLPLLATLLCCAVTRPAVADTPTKVTYNDQILPIFKNACLNCHNPDKKKAGLDLSTYQASLQGSENGKVLQSGNAAASLLFKCVRRSLGPKPLYRFQTASSQHLGSRFRTLLLGGRVVD